jgi:hypothetical protein
MLFEGNINLLGKLLLKRGFRLSIGLVPENPMTLGQVLSGNNVPNWAFLFQGKIIDESYLIDSLQHVRNFGSSNVIILSTYEGDITPKLQEFCISQQIHIVKVLDPGSNSAPFSQNLSRQIETTYQGLAMAMKLGSLKCVKIRVDQSFLNFQSLSLIDLLVSGSFPLVSNPTSRIIGTSFNSYLTIPLFLSDMIQFGLVTDLIQYWQPCPPSEMTKRTEEIYREAGPDLMEWRYFPESWLATRYMKSIGYRPTHAAILNESFWSERAGVVDASTIGLSWQKSLIYFSTNYHSVKWFEETFTSDFQEIHFYEWIQYITVRT